MTAPVKIGAILPPGNPTVEAETRRMAPDVELALARLVNPPSSGATGEAEGMEGRARAYVDTLDVPARQLAGASPSVVILAHTASSYVNGFGGEPALVARLSSWSGAPVVTAAGAVRAALLSLGVKRLALGTPYPESIMALGRAYWQAAGFDVVSHRRLGDIPDIYATTEAQARDLARGVDTAAADGVLLSGTGMPTVGVLAELERELDKPVVSSNQALLWQALRVAGVPRAIPGFGRLLSER
jgi:maleate cis-trans isomerase